MKLSIITINKNNAVGLERTIQSVVDQAFDDYEYIVIDGNSEDTSVEAIKKHEDKIAYWVSEPDTGIYNAMNKGIRKAQGDFCLFLNSGDWLIDPATLHNAFIEIDKTPEADIYFSDARNSNDALVIYSEIIDFTSMVNESVNHQNSLIRRSLFLNHEYYDEKLKISSDWEFFLKEYFIYKSKFFHIKTHISIYDTTGISSIEIDTLWSEREIIIRMLFEEVSDLLIAGIRYHNRPREAILYNIQHREGLGLRFILDCFKAWLLRDKLT
jgi:glycosyltransferase involved in cell wall biosynthesis